MITIADVRAAKARFEDHCQQHKCRPGQCGTRRQLWLAYQATGERWGED